ncbi:hypothetical protein M947_02290 [Sulfurimonas hongkongensis]|uniref:ATP-dependent nuclease subunit B n=1 Tax=Sulfurimonas hongkongensis TaxID=1172190 RepID=T0KUM7_9BACT|nr:hypothetical protein [Sulfurimonas hongkongensis]EQB40659.1 hypothetical protein M947_02290 [Sulfurimonas hongkongensis]
MIKIILSIFLLLLFSGCVAKYEDVQVKPNEKVFEQEDTLILFALRAAELKQYDKASSIFNTLYEKSNKKEYLYESLQNDLFAQKYERAVKRVDAQMDEELEDLKLVRIKIIALIGDEKLQEARVLALALVEKSKEVDDYILVSEIYVKQKKFDTALKYLESAYTKNYNEKILDKMSIILYVNLQRNKDAIAQLETHARMHGCSKIICTRLIGFYSNENNVDGLLSVYLRYYELEKNDEIAKKIVQIYAYKKDFIKLMSFLQDSGVDDDLLLQVYINSKNYSKAAILAKKLYEDRGDLNYLAQSAIFEYESHKDKNDKKMQASVIKKLKKAIAGDKKPLYLNYLGYLLIDHSINIKEGISYIREALSIEPDSAYYLDSLAWGYYKLGDCKRAYKIISKVVKLEGGDDEEVVKHLKAIKKCLENQEKEKNKR